MTRPILKLDRPLSKSRRLNSQNRKTLVRINRQENSDSKASLRTNSPVHNSPKANQVTVEQLIESLKQRYPVVSEGKPLAIGIAKKIRKKHGWSPNQVRLVLSRITSETSYLEAVAAEGAVRYRLNGEVAYPVLDHHREYARQILYKRKNKNAPIVSRGAGESCESDSMPHKPVDKGLEHDG